MSFIGNVFAAQSAKVIGKYNQAVYNQQAAYAKQQSVMAHLIKVVKRHLMEVLLVRMKLI